MRFINVGIDSVVHVDAPVRLTSATIVERLRPALTRLRIRADVLYEIAGIRERRIWDDPMPVASAAALAGRKALDACGVDKGRIGVLISTSVSRDHIEPSTASVVHGILDLPATCRNFDVGNACLAFIDGMDLAGRMIEHGDIAAALIVDGESSNEVIARTVERLNRADCTADQFRAEFASLTLGSGATAMVLSRNGTHRFVGGVSRAATAFSHLCRGTMDQMVTDTRVLLEEGLKLAASTFAAAGWDPAGFDEFAIHQVSAVHTTALMGLLGLDPAKVLTIFGEYGNVGPASVPMVLSKLDELGRLRPGHRVGLMGIGSGLNCTMAEIVW
ncbi:MAG TPA: 3-oxoacyl-ACP synthase III [Candidatus Limnocylindrales bacterium]|nr:3-oxoacyl-ACP synthase III [Candidatus Limnocylindrales bacterium]